MSESGAILGPLEPKGDPVLDAVERTLAIVVDAVEERTGYWDGHSVKVSDICHLLAVSFGLTEPDLTTLRVAAYCHDIGMLVVPDEILLREGRLTDSEREIMARHIEVGSKIARSLPEASPAAPVIETHHEWFDGSGYPRGIRGESISILSRILAVADAFEAIISARPHRAARSVEEALIEIEASSGSQFDPVVVMSLARKIRGQR